MTHIAHAILHLLQYRICNIAHFAAVCFAPASAPAPVCGQVRQTGASGQTLEEAKMINR
jgi:hypothetical protein